MYLTDTFLGIVSGGGSAADGGVQAASSGALGGGLAGSKSFQRQRSAIIDTVPEGEEVTHPWQGLGLSGLVDGEGGGSQQALVPPSVVGCLDSRHSVLTLPPGAAAAPLSVGAQERTMRGRGRLKYQGSSSCGSCGSFAPDLLPPHLQELQDAREGEQQWLQQLQQQPPAQGLPLQLQALDPHARGAAGTHG